MAIVDWDVHVANGAERIFWDRPDVLALSLHQRDWYPAHAGALRATGGPRAEGATVNVPLPAATTDAGYALAVDAVVAPVLRAFRPELILVAAGQDASVLDPTGRMLVSAAGFRALAERVALLADELCEGRLVAATEGGYSPLYNPFCLLAVVEGLAGAAARTSRTHGSTTRPCAPPARRPTSACAPRWPPSAARSRAGLPEPHGFWALRRAIREEVPKPRRGGQMRGLCSRRSSQSRTTWRSGAGGDVDHVDGALGRRGGRQLERVVDAGHAVRTRTPSMSAPAARTAAKPVRRSPAACMADSEAAELQARAQTSRRNQRSDSPPPARSRSRAPPANAPVTSRSSRFVATCDPSRS